MGTLDPESIHLPGIYVDRLIQCDQYEKRIERLKLAKPTNGGLNGQEKSAKGPSEDALRRERIVRRAAQEFKVSAISWTDELVENLK